MPFFRRFPANPPLLVLQLLVYNLMRVPLEPKFLKSHQIQTKISNYIPQAFRKFKFEVAVRRHFLIIARSVQFSLFSTMTSFQLDDFLWQTNSSNHTKLQLKAYEYIPNPFPKN